MPIGTGNRDALQDEIRRYQPSGETPISSSPHQAADDLGGEGMRTILLVSDGEETCDADPCETATAIAGAASTSRSTSRSTSSARGQREGAQPAAVRRRGAVALGAGGVLAATLLRRRRPGASPSE